MTLAVSVRVVELWFQKKETEKGKLRDERILELWLACKTQEEISKKVDISRSRVSEILENARNGKLSELQEPKSLKYFDVWSFNNCDPAYGIGNFPGRIPGQIIENLLHHFTEPFNIVLDLMAGSGTTIDVCKAMLQRYQG